MTPGRDDEPRDTSERPRKSWREIDAARDGKRSGARAEPRPTSPAAQARAAAASKEYLRQLDGALFSKKPGGGQGEALTRAVRDAVGTPELTDACRAYRRELGIPEDPALVTLFLDARDSELLVAVLDTLAARADAGSLRASSGLRTQLRLLEQSPDDEVAARAEELLPRL